MPSPFPGMDPFLEHPDVFPDFHDSLNAYLRESLQKNLPSPYFAAIGRRVWVEISKRYVGPDVNVVRAAVSRRSQSEQQSGVVVADAPRTKAKLVRIPHDERREPFLEIYVGQGRDKRLVTTIEVLSLANKTPGEHGRDLYLAKQREILASKVHLVEIDLLRAGEHTTAVPRDEAIAQAGPFDYHICAHRFDKLEDYLVYPIRLEERLPELTVPLLPGDPDVTVDLQAVFDRCYDTGPYRREIEYREDDLVPPLSSERVAWAKGLVALATTHH